MNLFKRELGSLMDSLRDFFKIFDQANKSSQIPLPKPKIEIRSAKSRDNLFSHYHKDIIERSKRQLLSVLKITTLTSLSSESLNYKVLVTEIVNLNHREILHLYKYRYYVNNNCEKIESNYVYYIQSSVGMTKALLALLGTYSVRTKCVPRILACTKRLLNLSTEVIINVLIARPYFRSVVFPLKNKQTRSS